MTRLPASHDCGKGTVDKSKTHQESFHKGGVGINQTGKKTHFFIFIVFFIKRKPTKKKGTHTATVEPGWPKQGQHPAAAVTGPSTPEIILPFLICLFCSSLLLDFYFILLMGRMQAEGGG